MSSENVQSHSKVQSLLSQFFGIEISAARVNRLRRELSDALLIRVQQAHQFVQAAPYVHSDETSFKQGNADGKNPAGRKGWLWTIVTNALVLFEGTLSRGEAIAQQLMGNDYAGIVISDRYRGYEWVDATQRQMCWAHIKRDIAAMCERTGVSQGIGLALQRRQKRLFRLWHQVRDGTLTRAHFQLKVALVRRGFRSQLEQAVKVLDCATEKSPLAKNAWNLQRVTEMGRCPVDVCLS